MGALWDKTCRLNGAIYNSMKPGCGRSTDSVCTIAGKWLGEPEEEYTSARFRGRVYRSLRMLERNGRVKRVESFNGRSYESLWSVVPRKDEDE